MEHYNYAGVVKTPQNAMRVETRMPQARPKKVRRKTGSSSTVLAAPSLRSDTAEKTPETSPIAVAMKMTKITTHPPFLLG